jgi:hypothetical protein
MDTQDALPDRMRELAASGHPRSDELVSAADDLDMVMRDYDCARTLVREWARARRIWSECSGEPLI